MIASLLLNHKENSNCCVETFEYIYIPLSKFSVPFHSLLAHSGRTFPAPLTVAPARGAGGAVAPPNVEKGGPRNSSKFDEKNGKGVRIHLRREKIINTKYL